MHLYWYLMPKMAALVGERLDLALVLFTGFANEKQPSELGCWHLLGRYFIQSQCWLLFLIQQEW